jgi:hypothetical protein
MHTTLFRNKLVWIAVGVGLFTTVAATTFNTKPRRYHSEGEIIKLTNGNLPLYDNGVFVGSGRCGGCHGIDPVNFANITMDGELVNPTENWRGTMMANSAKDPFWRAKVAHEQLVNPGHAQELINTCARCHAPVGVYTGLQNGVTDFDINLLDTDSMSRDGVNCSICHQQRMETLGTEFSGHLHFHTDTIWGPYVSEEMDYPIFFQAMQSFVGYTPVGNHKVKQSEMCAGCHTLETHTADLDGNLTGQKFIEQATYHEWKNSAYRNSTDPLIHKECQNCHMPELNEPIVLASGYSFLQGRQPFGQHWFVGGNTFMLEVLKNNITSLGLTANANHFNLVYDRSMIQLQNQTATLDLTQDNTDGDTARFTVKLKNLAGHKFPSGYPSRRAFVEFVITDNNGTEVFRSGGVDSDYRVIGENPTGYEPHYNVITSPDQVQIYEMVMGDVNNNKTTILERAATMLKDNRLTPLGYDITSPTADTTAIVGGASDDPDFNIENGQSGSGTDELHFHVPIQGWIDGDFHVTARLLYQTAPPHYMDEMFAFDDPKINAFKAMYQAEGPDPVQIKMDELNFNVTGIEPINATPSLFPNPTYNGWVQIKNNGTLMSKVELYDNQGKYITTQYVGSSASRIQLPGEPGVYLLVIHTSTGKHLERVIRR